MVKAALTGNYGMGKSYVLSLFRQFGAVTLDSDRIVEILLKKPDVIRKTIKIFGKEVLAKDGSLNKTIIARKIFNNNEIREKYEALLHPLVLAEVDSFIEKLCGQNRIVIVEVPLLFEKGYEQNFEYTITVFTTQKTAVDRLMKEGISRSDVLQRYTAQLPVLDKINKSTYVIDNNGSKKETRTQVGEIFTSLSKKLQNVS